MGLWLLGSRGTTRFPGQAPVRGLIQEVTPPEAATIHIELEGAILAFHWQFDSLPGGRTKITQRAVLQGEQASAYVPQVESTFPSNLPEGMSKIAARMAKSETVCKGST